MQTHIGRARGKIKKYLLYFVAPFITPYSLVAPRLFHIIAFAHQRHYHWVYLYTAFVPPHVAALAEPKRHFRKLILEYFVLRLLGALFTQRSMGEYDGTFETLVFHISCSHDAIQEVRTSLSKRKPRMPAIEGIR